LCIPANAGDDPQIRETYRKALNDAANFILLHEAGHVFYRHPGNESVPAGISRANEEAADRFALDLLARVGEVPIGVNFLFFVMTHLQGDTTLGDETAYQRSLAAKTHPVSTARLEAFARQLNVSATGFNSGFKPGAQTTAFALSLVVQQLAYALADVTTQKWDAAVGKSVAPEDLAPRRKGRLLAPPCGRVTSNERSFDGSLHGQIGPNAIDIMLTREGDRVTGSFSMGPGFGRLEGTIRGAVLNLRWTEPFTLGPIAGGPQGRGVLSLENGEYRGTWGAGDSVSGLSLVLSSEP
jgi:hypothetical protein